MIHPNDIEWNEEDEIDPTQVNATIEQLEKDYDYNMEMESLDAEMREYD